MLFSEELLNDFNYMFQHVKYVPGSHLFEDQGHRTRERFEVQVYNASTSKWGKNLYFHTWKTPNEKKFSVNYDSMFSDLYDPKRECLKVLHYVMEYIKNHPKARILIGSMGWNIGTTPVLQSDLDLSTLKLSLDELKFERECSKCKKNSVFLENECCYSTPMEESDVDFLFRIYPKFHKSYFELSARENNHIHLMTKNIFRKIKEKYPVKEMKMEWADTLSEHSYLILRFTRG